MRRTRIRIICALFCALLLCGISSVPRADAEEQTAENLSAKCKYDGDFSVHADRLRDTDYESNQRVNKGKTLTVSWKDDVPVKQFLLSFYNTPVAYTVFQYDGNGTLLSEKPGILLYNNLIETLPDCRKVAIRADADECAFCSLYAYGEGTVSDYHPYEPTLEKADYLTFAMHPDDDVLFLGAIYPIYEAERGLSGVSIIMSTKLPNAYQRERRQEALNGEWILGIKTQPIFGGFPDIPPDYYKVFHHTFTVDDVTRYAVWQMRTYRPEVVMTQDLNGEYGHWQHKVLAEGVLAAVPLAADASYQPKGYPATEPWEVKKLYIHLYDQNKLTLDVLSPIDALGGKSAFDAAKEAFLCHKTQIKKDNHHVSTKEYSLAEFGLAYTTVGLDSPGMNDMFEHIDPYTLSVTPTPEPTAEPTPEPTPVPTVPLTEAPTEEPTAIPVDTPDPTDIPIPIDVPTAVPTEVPQPQTVENGSDILVFVIGGGLLLLLIGLLIALLLVHKRR